MGYKTKYSKEAFGYLVETMKEIGALAPGSSLTLELEPEDIERVRYDIYNLLDIYSMKKNYRIRKIGSSLLITREKGRPQIILRRDDSPVSDEIMTQLISSLPPEPTKVDMMNTILKVKEAYPDLDVVLYLKTLKNWAQKIEEPAPPTEYIPGGKL